MRRIVHISTTDVYGHPGQREVTEDEPQSGFANWYAQSKREAEWQLADCSASLPEIVVLRPATVYGPGSVEVIGEIAEAIRGGRMLLIGGGSATAGLCYVENLLDAVLLALDRAEAAGRVFNVADGLDVSWARFSDDLAAGLGCRAPRLSLPYPLAAAIAVTLERAYRLARSLDRPENAAAALAPGGAGARARPGLQQPPRCARELGWEPRVGYEQGLEATLAWLREREAGAGATRGHAARAAAG